MCLRQRIKVEGEFFVSAEAADEFSSTHGNDIVIPCKARVRYRNSNNVISNRLCICNCIKSHVLIGEWPHASRRHVQTCTFLKQKKNKTTGHLVNEADTDGRSYSLCLISCLFLLDIAVTGHKCKINYNLWPGQVSKPNIDQILTEYWPVTTKYHGGRFCVILSKLINVSKEQSQRLLAALHFGTWFSYLLSLLFYNYGRNTNYCIHWVWAIEQHQHWYL